MFSSHFPSFFISAEEARLHKLQPPEEEEDWWFSGLYLPSRNGKLTGVEWYDPSALAKLQCFSNFQLLLDLSRPDQNVIKIKTKWASKSWSSLDSLCYCDWFARLLRSHGQHRCNLAGLEEFCSFIWMFFLFISFWVFFFSFFFPCWCNDSLTPRQFSYHQC